MENFEFKSQICTTREQSERLLKLGLKKDTADMWHIAQIKDWRGNNILKRNQKWWLSFDGIGVGVGFDQFERVPAWSLHRLLVMLYSNLGECMVFFPNTTYEEIIGDIEYMISRGTFNRDYLEEKI